MFARYRPVTMLFHCNYFVAYTKDFKILSKIIRFLDLMMNHFQSLEMSNQKNQMFIILN